MELRRRVTELEEELDEKELQLQVLAGLAEENTILGSKVDRMQTAKTRLRLESDTVFMVMEGIRALHDMTKDEVMKVTNLKKRELELEAKLPQCCEHAAAAKVCEDLVKKKLSSVEGKLASSRVECANLRWGRSQRVS